MERGKLLEWRGRAAPRVERLSTLVFAQPGNQRMNAFPMMAPFLLIRLTMWSMHVRVRAQLLQKTGQVFGMLFLLRKDPLQ